MSGASCHSGGGSVPASGAWKISYGASAGLNSLENLTVRSLRSLLFRVQKVQKVQLFLDKELESRFEATL